MFLKSGYTTLSGISIPNAIIRIPGVGITHTNESGEQDQDNFYLGIQYDVFATEDSTVKIESGFMTKIYVISEVSVIEDAYNILKEDSKFTDGVIVV